MKDLEIMVSATNTVIQEDDSMSPNIAKGSTVFIEKLNNGTHGLRDGAIYVFKTSKGLITRRYIIRSLDEIELRPINKEYESIIIKVSEMQKYIIMGGVVGVFTKL